MLPDGIPKLKKNGNFYNVVGLKQSKPFRGQQNIAFGYSFGTISPDSGTPRALTPTGDPLAELPPPGRRSPLDPLPEAPKPDGPQLVHQLRRSPRPANASIPIMNCFLGAAFVTTVCGYSPGRFLRDTFCLFTNVARDGADSLFGPSVIPNSAKNRNIRH